MDKEELEVFLKKSVTDSSIKRIIEMKSESALPKGENFTSLILRVTLKVVLGNGRIAKKSLIAKKENSGEAADRFRKDYKLFKTETSIYTNVLRGMDHLLEEFGDTEGPLWCKFIYFNQADTTIILEDLMPLGFKNVKRTESQDLDHARLALRGLGRYHAMAKVLEERGLLSKDDYDLRYRILFDEGYIRNFLYGGRMAFIKGMRATWGKEWAQVADKLSEMPFQEFLKKVQNCGNFDDSTFKCLNHGDCWSNNIMFKYDWQGRPIDVRFVDYQLPHYNSPCVDVTFYMHTSIQPVVRHQNYKSLVELYHESLTGHLARYGYKGSIPTLGDIESALERLSFFALTFFTGFFPVFNSKSTEALDLDKIFKTKGEEGFNISIYSEEGMIEKLREDLKRLVKM